MQTEQLQTHPLPTHQLQTQWITSSEEFLALRDEWNELLINSRCNTIFLTWEWQYTWWMNLAEGRSLVILTVRDGNQLVALAPMSLRPADYSRLVPFRVLEMLGAGSVGSDYLSIIVRSDDEGRALTELCRSMIARKFVIEMNNTDRASTIMTKAALRMRDLGCRTARYTQNFCPYIDLSGYTWNTYITRPGTSNGVRYHKKLRKLNRTFNVSLSRAMTEQGSSRDLEVLINLHLKRWNDKGGSNAFDSNELRNFHFAFSHVAFQKDWLRLYILRLDDAPAAAVYGFYYMNTFYYYQAGFDPQFSQYSVGQLSVGLTIEQAIAEGATEYDLLHGEEEYKYEWANNERELVCLSIYPPNLQGALCSQMMEIRKGVKTLILSRAPAGLRDRMYTTS
ncbi:MAG: GNAT family N-acetyltransferase [Gammaproteobacteria bacterium]|nr:GNAT family N-acetyltransferase [Gammaproteobacteria bacterium]